MSLINSMIIECFENLALPTHHKPEMLLLLSSSFCLPLYCHFCLWLSVSSTSILASRIRLSVVSQSPTLSVSISLCLPASYESVLVLTGLAMGCFAKGFGAEQLSEFAFIQPAGGRRKREELLLK